MRKKRKLLLPLFAITIAFLLSGCVNKPLEDLRLSLALTKKYGEIFIVADSFVSSGNWLNAGPLVAVCYPLSDKNLTFKATYSYKNNKLYDDEYIEAIVREEACAEMEQILSQYYTDFLLDVDIYIKGPSQEGVNVSEASISKLEEIYGEKMIISFDMIINIDEIDDYKEVEPIFQKYSERFTNGQVDYSCYYEPVSTINECQEIKDKRKYISNKGFVLATQMGTRQQHPMYRYCFENGKFSLYEIKDVDGVKRFDENGNVIFES
ncbi:MAG: hypothetical protein ACI4J7_07240 [Ruminiclostridium sp.]